MYQNNIYIDNYEELKAITKPNGDKADMGVPYRNLLIKNGFLDAE